MMDSKQLEFETLSKGPDEAVRDALAGLRIRVFREWPYLYEGDRAYEATYLERYTSAPDAVVILARADKEIVGAATAMPLRAEVDEFRTPFERAGFDPDAVYYFGESVLLPEWRGKGAGHVFFDLREQAAVRCGATITAFCAVVRDEHDPRRPADHRALDPFWRKRGYVPEPGLVTKFSWKEIGESEERAKPMQFWLKRSGS